MNIQTGTGVMRKAMNLLLWLTMLLGGLAHAGTVTYVYTDPQGTPLAEADASGNITATFDYAPYGSQALGTPPDGPGYTGHVNDPESGLVYMQARYYDPAVGRFVSTDPVGSVVGNVFNFNRFAYADNNPVVNIDPDGRCTGTFLCGNGEGVGGVGNVTFASPSMSEGGGGQSQHHAPGCDGSVECDEVAGTKYKLLHDQAEAEKKAGIVGLKVLVVNAFTDGLGRVLGRFASFIRLGDKVSITMGRNENQILHTFRHTDVLGLNRSDVRQAVMSDMRSIGNMEVGRPYNRPISVGGIDIEYTAYKLKDGSVNIGRIDIGHYDGN